MNTTNTETRTAADAYQEHATAIDGLMRRLKHELFKDKHEAAANPKNWGYAGSLEHVRELLQDAVGFMANEED